MATRAVAQETVAQEAVAQEADQLRERITARRVRFRDAVTQLSGRAQSVELIKLLLVPGALFLVGGFGAMFLGWYGAARTVRSVEQVPYLISGGLMGLGLVFVGTLLLASAFWMTQLQRFADRAEERSQRELLALEDRLRGELSTSSPPARATRSGSASSSQGPNGGRKRSTPVRAVK